MAIREIFIKKVKDLIVENHAKSNDSFILGISGKWGEGKTKFLDDLEEELGNPYAVIKLSPWKYASDKTAFLRHFLDELNKKTEKKIDLDKLYCDVSENKLIFPWYYLWIGLGVLIFIFLIISYPHSFGINRPLNPNSFVQSIFIKNVIKTAKYLWIPALSIALLPLLLKIITFQKSNHAISILTDFDKILGQLLSNIYKYVIVYVDDLDRVTPKIARDVLDDLRTFFDKKNLSFIVTGDHSVLERYIGQDILPNKEMGEQVEEGRRYLKKIFNIYWRLLPPTNAEFDVFIEEEVQKRADKLASVFQEEGLAALKTYLRKYFEKNFRQVIRFLDYIVFYFDAIKTQIESAEIKEKEILSDLTQHPLLVVRILLFQDICNPLYEAILKNPKLLYTLEEHADKGDIKPIENEISSVRKEMSSSQILLMQQLLQEEERFFNKQSLRVNNLEPFLYISADQNCLDMRGASAEDFVNFLRNSKVEFASNALISGGTSRITENVNLAATNYGSLAAIEEKTKYLETLFGALLTVPADHISHKLFAEQLAGVDLADYYAQAPNYEPRMKLFILFWQWLDLIAEKDWFASLNDTYLKKYPLNFAEDFDQFQTNSAGIFTTKVMARWFNDYYPKNMQDCLNKITSIAPQLNIECLKNEIKGLGEDLANNTITTSGTERDKRFEILKNYISGGIELFTPKILEKIRNLDHDFCDWSLSKAGDGKIVWSREQIENQLIEMVFDGASVDQLKVIFEFVCNRISQLNEKFWDKIASDHLDTFLDGLPILINEGYSNIAPSEAKANLLYKSLIQKVSALQDPVKQNEYVSYIDKKHWLWVNLPQINKKFLPKKLHLKDTVDAVKNSWS